MHIPCQTIQIIRRVVRATSEVFQHSLMMNKTRNYLRDINNQLHFISHIETKF